jgi:hypothetical protein
MIKKSYSSHFQRLFFHVTFDTLPIFDFYGNRIIIDDIIFRSIKKYDYSVERYVFTRFLFAIGDAYLLWL